MEQPQKTILISVHDVTPLYENEIEIILKNFENCKKCFLITPFWHEKYHLNQDFASQFIHEENVLHGYSHQGGQDLQSRILFKNPEIRRELKGLSEVQTREQITHSLELFHIYFKNSPQGYVPPMWAHNQYSHKILKELHFEWTESVLEITNLTEKQSFFNIPISFDYGENQFFTKLAFLLSKKCVQNFDISTLRFAIHPQDIKRGYLNQIKDLLSFILDSGYAMEQYSNFINRKKLQ